MRTTTLMGLIAMLACAMPAMADDEGLPRPGLYAKVTFGGAASSQPRVFLNGVPLMTPAAPAPSLGIDDAAAEKGADWPAIIGVSALGAALILVVIGEGLEDAFEDADWDPFDEPGDGGGESDGCSGVLVNGECVGGG